MKSCWKVVIFYLFRSLKFDIINDTKRQEIIVCGDIYLINTRFANFLQKFFSELLDIIYSFNVRL